MTQDELQARTGESRGDFPSLCTKAFAANRYKG